MTLEIDSHQAEYAIDLAERLARNPTVREEGASFLSSWSKQSPKAIQTEINSLKYDCRDGSLLGLDG